MKPIASDWRPFEPSREEVERAREHNCCNRHRDCEAADEAARARGKRNRYGSLGAEHCHDEDCEDCFGC
jgi:hypothetical protein